MRAIVRWAVVLSLAAAAYGQSGVGLQIDHVTDNRVSSGGFAGQLELRVKVTGTGLDKATASRVLVKEAKDDKGTQLTDGKQVPDFFPREYNMGMLSFSVQQPARSASSVRLKGTVELYVPTRDPSSIVKIDRALSKPDAPLSSKALKAAKLTLTLLSTKGYIEAKKSRKIDDKKIAEVRAEGKKRGVPEEEIEAMIGLAKALEGLDETPPENAIILSGTKSDFDRIYRIEILGSDGKPIDTPQRGTSTRGDDSIMTIIPAQTPPENAALQIYVLTDKSKLSFPFDLKVTLP